MANTFTPEQIAQILEEFFKAVGTRQYIGARYVPIFGRKEEESIEWDNTKPYEPLTIVLYQGNSYTSRQYVPAGVQITNEEFWAVTGNYNAQIEQYRRETARALQAAQEAQESADSAQESADSAQESADNAQGDIDTLLPKSEFSSENTVKHYIDNAQNSADNAQNDIDTLLPKASFSDSLTVKQYIDNEDEIINTKTPSNIIGITDDMIRKLGDIPREFNGKTFSVQGMEYVNGYLYVGYSLQSQYCGIAKIELATMEVIAFNELDNYVHFNSLCYYEGMLYTVSPETSVIDGVTSSYIVVIDPNTLTIDHYVSIGSNAYMNNLVVAPYGSANKPLMQAFVRRNGFVDYMTYENSDGEKVTQSVSRYKFVPNSQSVADGCCMINATGGGAGSIFAYLLSNYHAESVAKNGILFNDLYGITLAFAQLPDKYDAEFEGIAVLPANDKFLMCDVRGSLYEITISDIVNLIAKYGQTYYADIYLPNPATSRTQNLKVGVLTENTHVVRRFALPGTSLKFAPSDLANLFGVAQSSFVLKSTATYDQLTVSGMKFYSNSAIAFICCTYVLDNTLPNERVYNLDKIRAQPVVASGTALSIDNVQNLTDDELAAQMSGTIFTAARCSLQPEGSGRDFSPLLWFKGLF